MKPKPKMKRILFAVLILAVALIIAGDWSLAVMIYNGNFNQRFESYAPLMRYVEDFDGLQRTKYEFPSNHGQKLTGYLYTAAENPRGIIVMAHGFGGGGHNSYMGDANYFAHHGYLVFAYDATGNDESEGEGVGGLPQGVIDLDHAITFVEESGNFPNLPIALFGHSWGGYSVCSVLTYHPEVKAVIACSGFNSSAGMFEAEGKKQAGAGVYLVLPFVRLHEWLKFGGYATNTAMDGLANSDAAVMILHSLDDEVVPVEYGYNIYFNKYKDDSRFSFIRFADKGHSYFNDETYTAAFNAEFDNWLETLDYDYTASEYQERFAADKLEYMHKNLDRDKWCHSLDTALFAEFVAFYDQHISASPSRVQ